MIVAINEYAILIGQNRQQTYFTTLEDQVAPDNPVLLMDTFIDKLELQQVGFQKTVHHSEGRPPYVPGVLLKRKPPSNPLHFR